MNLNEARTIARTLNEDHSLASLTEAEGVLTKARNTKLAKACADKADLRRRKILGAGYRKRLNTYRDSAGFSHFYTL